ncbi:hypothetical protein GCM10011591_08980 [Nocardia camponoti]|uniref:Shikimate kinase n=1 Tax=Nocardia camponoti TaxID=1616106 RepID=A0A917QAT4_9NOCA|nr:hypothetical protein GCM10011591_08980 [Nocardia camponoti]
MTESGQEGAADPTAAVPPRAEGSPVGQPSSGDAQPHVVTEAAPVDPIGRPGGKLRGVAEAGSDQPATAPRARVVLVGPPGSGKSTIGRRLARELGLELYDTDAGIEADTGRTIPDIFANDGEPVFRRIEEEVVQRAVREHEGVVSLGGGSVLSADTRAALRGATVVYLEISVGEGLRRTGSSKGRPLLNGADAAAKYRELMRNRRPLYREVATVRVRTDGRSPGRVVRMILAKLGLESVRTDLPPTQTTRATPPSSAPTARAANQVGNRSRARRRARAKAAAARRATGEVTSTGSLRRTSDAADAPAGTGRRKGSEAAASAPSGPRRTDGDTAHAPDTATRRGSDAGVSAPGPRRAKGDNAHSSGTATRRGGETEASAASGLPHGKVDAAHSPDTATRGSSDHTDTPSSSATASVGTSADGTRTPNPERAKRSRRGRSRRGGARGRASTANGAARNSDASVGTNDSASAQAGARSSHRQPGAAGKSANSPTAPTQRGQTGKSANSTTTPAQPGPAGKSASSPTTPTQAGPAGKSASSTTQTQPNALGNSPAPNSAAHTSTKVDGGNAASAAPREANSQGAVGKPNPGGPAQANSAHHDQPARHERARRGRSRRRGGKRTSTDQTESEQRT